MSEVKYVKDTPYGCENDYVAPDELTVTITLAEYRGLVGFRSKYSPELNNLKNENWRLEKEVEEMRKKICVLLGRSESSNAGSDISEETRTIERGDL